MLMTTSTAILLAAALLCAPPPPAPAQEGSPRGIRRALLIGIDDYRSPEIPDLRGCRNDVQLLRHVLDTRYGFDEIRLLLDAEATHDAILLELERSARATRSNDVLFVHFSGHGSQQPDQDGDEKDDGLDETLVAHDSRSGEVIDIVDDRIEDVLAAIETGAHVVVSVDACHSGTGTRDLTELRPRDVPPDPRTDRYRSTSVRTRGGAPHLAITSALARERALDGPVDGVPHGLFTRAFATALAEQPLQGERRDRRSSALELEGLAIDAYRDIVDRLGCAHRASTPKFELVGYRDPLEQKRRWEAPLLPVPRPGKGARLCWLPVIGTTGSVRLIGGAALGATPGTCWAIFGPGETSFPFGRAIAWGTVTDADGTTARLALAGGDGEARSYDDCRAVRIAASDGAVAMRVKLALPLEDQQRARTLLKDLLPRAEVVPATPGQLASFVLTNRETGAGYEILAGDERTAVDTRDTLEAAARVMARSLTTSRLLALDNPTSTMRIRVWTDLVGGVVDDREIGILRARRKSGEDEYRTYREADGIGARNCLQLHLEADQPCYVSVVDVDGSGRIGLLFPNDLSEENGYLPQGFVPAGRRIDVPDAVAEDCAAGFLLPFLTPGSETIRVFATEDLATAERIREAVRTASAIQREEPLDSIAVEEVLTGLREDLIAVAAREIGVMGVGVARNRPRRERAEEPSAGDDRPAAADRPDGAAGGGDWCAISIRFRVRQAGL